MRAGYERALSSRDLTTRARGQARRSYGRDRMRIVVRTESRVFLYSAVEIIRSPVASFFLGAMVVVVMAGAGEGSFAWLVERGRSAGGREQLGGEQAGREDSGGRWGGGQPA